MRHISLALIAAVAAVGVAQNPPRISPDGRPDRLFKPMKGLNMHDKMAIKDASVSNLVEIKSSEMALKMSRNANLRDYAKLMIKDHSAAHEELKLIAKRKGVMVSKALPPDKQAALNRLSRLRGAAFDRAYRDLQVKGHIETAAKFEKHLKGGQDDDVKSYLVKNLPPVKMHLKVAQANFRPMSKMDAGMLHSGR